MCIRDSFSISPSAPNSRHSRSYSRGNNGWSAERTRSTRSPAHSTSSARTSPGARSSGISFGGGIIRIHKCTQMAADEHRSVSIAGRRVHRWSRRAPSIILGRMDATHLATLRRLDEAHLLHPFTDPVDLHRQGTHVIEAVSYTHLRAHET